MSLMNHKPINPIMAKFVNGLKSRSEDTRATTALELQRYVTTELCEVSIDELTSFLEEFNGHIKAMVTSEDSIDKKGGIYAIMSLVDVDVGQTGQRIGRFANFLQKLIECSQDISVIDLAAKAVGRLNVAWSTYTTGLVEGLFKSSVEWLQAERNELRRHAAVFVLRELASSVPTFFFQQIQQFFDVIFEGVRDPRAGIREVAVTAIRVALSIASQRETKETQQPPWYEQCLTEICIGMDDTLLNKEKTFTREERIHGSILALNELLRCSNNEWEKLYRQLHHLTQYQNHISTAPKKFSSKKFKGHRSTQTSKLNHLTDIFHPNSGHRSSLENGFDELVCSSATCKNLMLGKYDEFCPLILSQKGSRNYNIQSGLLLILPRIAALNKTQFSKSYLPQSINFLLTVIKSKEKDKAGSFICLGLLCVAVGRSIVKYLPQIFAVCKSTLPTRDTPTKKKIVDPAICICISLVARAVGQTVQTDVQELLDPMMSAGLTAPLTISLQSLAADIPKLKCNIADGLLVILSNILCQKQRTHIRTSSLVNAHSSQDHHNVTNIVLALRTLGTFDFDHTGQSVTIFIDQISSQYLTSEHTDIRLEAVQTLLHLLRCVFLSPSLYKDISHFQDQPDQIYKIIGRILWVCASDVDPGVRLCVLLCLDETFDSHLSQSENLHALVYALNDENTSIRENAICVLGRLAELNPSYVHPLVRKSVMKFLDELEYSGIGRKKEQSVRMLGILIASAPSFMRHFVEPIMFMLLPRLTDKDPNPSVTICILTAIGNLAEGSGEDMRFWLKDILSILIDMLMDGTAVWKRHISLMTLGQLVENTGYVVHPYTQYPNLLDTLLLFLKTEQQPAVRQETLRVLGLLGALDPYKHKMNTGMIKIQHDTGVALICMTNNKEEDLTEMTTSEMLVNMNYSMLEDFYPACALSVLMRIIKDPALKQHRSDVIRAVSFIFQSLGVKGVPYLPRVIPPLLHVIRTSESNLRNFLFTQLAFIIKIVQLHIRNHVSEIVDVLREFWQIGKYENTITIIYVMETVAMAVGAEFKIYIKDMMPMILKTLLNDLKQPAVTKRLLDALQKFGPTIEEYLHMILPHVVRLFDCTETTLDVRRAAIQTVERFTTYLDLSDYVCQLIHPLLRTIENQPDLRPSCMELLCCLATQLGSNDYESFISGIQRIITKHKITHLQHETIVATVLNGEEISKLEMLEYTNSKKRYDTNPDTLMPIRKGTLSTEVVESLQATWSFQRLVSKDDWLEWLRRLSIELMKSSPSPALKSCYTLSTTYVHLSKELFNAAFVSVWSELNENLQADLVNSLKQALTSQDIPEITQTLLNLAEFMEHSDKGALPLELDLVSQKAVECRAYAKALHYKEEQFHNGSNIQILESLISINNKLGQTEAAAGLLEYAEKNNRKDMKLQERWYEKLHDWDKALEAYRSRQEEEVDNFEHTLGQMRCLEALGEWGKLYSVSSSHWSSIESLNDGCRRQMARASTAAAWAMGQWESMEEYTKFLPTDTQEGSYYRAVMAIHKNEFQKAQELIEHSRELLDTELTAMVGESYQRAYGSMVAVQMLAELEEVIQIKLVPEKKRVISQIWWERLQGCQRVVEDWQRILQVRSLVLSPQEDMRGWLKFAALCRKTGRLTLAHKTLVTLYGCNPGHVLPTVPPQVTYQYCKYLHACPDKKTEAYNQMRNFLRGLPQVVGEASASTAKPLLLLVARVYHKLGVWFQEINGLNEKTVEPILNFLQHAKETDDSFYKAWHSYACTNFEALSLYVRKPTKYAEGSTEPVAAQEDNIVNGEAESNSEKPNKLITEFAKAACIGFTRSITLNSKNNTLQDTLRLLTVCFEVGSNLAVHQILSKGFKTIAVDNWLQVIPQLIARIDTPHHLVNSLIQNLLVNVGKQHPQALLYPLSVAAKSAEQSRTKSADIVIGSMREHSDELVNQALMISEELIRVAILWHERWHEGLEEASRLYFAENNIAAMFRVLRPLHMMMDKGPVTVKEKSFDQAYGEEIKNAAEWCSEYQRTKNFKNLNQAWELYYQVFRRLNTQLPHLASLDMEAVSPRLHACKDLDIAVPGSYSPNSPINKISSIQPNIQVLGSKQKPRKLYIRGSDGHDYVFLLKGHEDLRQDERVMQLFGLVNTLLVSNSETFRRNLTIQRYAVIPLSTNSGLIGWVPNCDTLHSLIRDWREKKNITLVLEHKIMSRMVADPEHLTLMQKVEVLEHALEMTKGDDLSKLLWFKSPSSELWFDRRTNYTRSLAVMSMVGYVLGLGDRHPSNLMLHQLSGKIVHIDFGDCFEVAMAREKFPEKIPFRLTRMLINAMEVTGIEGTYRVTCESVMELLRSNKDSLMALLEAFVYDPLLNWRLVDKDKRKKSAGGGEEWDDTEDKEAAKGDPKNQDPTEPLDGGKIDQHRMSEAANKKAVGVVNRVRDKLTGGDFKQGEQLDVARQVDLLIEQATSHENLCQCYIGWCPFW